MLIKQSLPELPALLYAAQILYPGLNLMTIIQRAIFNKYGDYSFSLNDTQLIEAIKAFIVKWYPYYHIKAVEYHKAR